MRRACNPTFSCYERRTCPSDGNRMIFGIPGLGSKQAVIFWQKNRAIRELLRI